MRHLLEECRCALTINCISDDNIGQTLMFFIKLFVPPAKMKEACNPWVEIDINNALRVLVNEEGPLTAIVTIKVLPPDEPLTVGLNNGVFFQEKTILHDELRFRSKGEIAIYEELKRRDVLFLPNPAAVFGTSALEYGAILKRREPDFLICLKGKWGILEINGDDFHSGIVKTTKDHERARSFQHYGVFFIQAYDLQSCKSDPVGVVDEFLKLLANHK
jgi:hypothetical protein